jgi:phenylalanyl-tRNA synthetase beta chain
MAILVNEKITAKQIIDCIKNGNQTAIIDIQIFDLYRGQEIETGFKSIALSLKLQDLEQTLTETQIDAIFSKVLTTLTDEIGAKLRD